MDTNATWIRAADESGRLTLRYQLRSLLTYASVREVHTTFMDLLREDYDYLHGVFGQPPAPGTQPEAPAPAPVRRQTPSPAAAVPSASVPAPAATPAPKPQAPEVDPSTGLPPRLRPDQKIKVMKHTIDVLEEIQKSETEPQPPVLPKQEPKAKLTVVEWTDPGLQALATTTVVPQLFPQHQPAAHQSTTSNAALISEREKKALLAKQQKEAEDATYARLVSEGIDPNGLLTKENLTEWITKKEMTFTQVAREKVGLPDSLVAAAARRFGIESSISKKRRQIIAAKTLANRR